MPQVMLPGPGELHHPSDDRETLTEANIRDCEWWLEDGLSNAAWEMMRTAQKFIHLAPECMDFDKMNVTEEVARQERLHADIITLLKEDRDIDAMRAKVSRKMEELATTGGED